MNNELFELTGFPEESPRKIRKRYSIRSLNRRQSPVLLEENSIVFEVKNNGAHLIVESTEGKIDFWPGTGKWITRNGLRGFGVMNLISHIKGIQQ